MAVPRIPGAQLAAGLATWTLAEYGVHRWVMHRRGGRDPLAVEHRIHHARPELTSLPLRLLGHAGVHVGALLVGAAARRPAVGIGFGAGYSLYEGLHWRAHHRPPWRWERTLRRRHLAHHAAGAGANFGVTLPLWDRVFGTEDPRPAPVRLRPRQTPTWVRPDDPDYVLTASG